jgi:ABC-type sugar transport system permease subunit
MAGTKATKTKQRKPSLEKRRLREGYVFIAPWVVGFLVFFLIPICQTVRMSMSKITQFSNMQMEWFGFENFRRIFVEDTKFISNIVTVFSDVFINTALIVIFSLIFAVILNKQFKGRGFFRALFFLPVLLGSGFIMQQLLGQNITEQATSVARGILLPKEVMAYLGPGIANTVSAFLSKISIVLWRTGVQILLFLAGLQSINSTLYEAAKIDAASEWEIFWRITLPMISPIVLLNCVFTIVDSFTDSSNPMVSYIIYTGIRTTRYETASAIAVMYLLIIMVTVGLVFLIMRNRTFENADR